MTAAASLTLDLLAGLGNLRLRAETLLSGTLAGMHRSPFQGFSAEFDQYRGYTPGDDPRFFDWKVFGRTGHAVVKRFRDETNTTLYLILDTSASMGFPAAGPFTKLSFASLFAAALATLAFRQRDAISLLHGAYGMRGELPPHAGGAHYQEILRRLEALKPEGHTDLQALLGLAAQRLKSGSMILIFTDLWQDPAPLLVGLRQIRARNQSVALVHVSHPGERRLREQGDMVYHDLESGERLRLQPEAFQAEYDKALQKHLDEVRGASQDLGVHWLSLDMAAPPDISLRAFLRDFGAKPGK